MKAVVSVIGKDKKGIIAAVSGELFRLNVNIEDISQTIMQEYFTMIMMVDLSESALGVSELNQALQVLGESLKVEISVKHEGIFQAMHTI